MNIPCSVYRTEDFLSDRYETNKLNKTEKRTAQKKIQHWHVGNHHRVEFSSDSELPMTYRTIRHLSAHLPGFKPESDRLLPKLVRIEHRTDSDTSLSQQPGEVVVNAPAEELFGPTLPHFLYGACRAEWLRREIYPVHAACFGDAKTGWTLVAGPSGSGKTSLTMEQARQNRLHPEKEIISADKTLINFDADGHMQAISGTQTVSVRKPDMPRWEGIEKRSVYESGDRVQFLLSRNCYRAQTPVRINRIFLVSLNDRSSNVKLNIDSARHQLFPLFLDKQREDILIGNGGAVLDGTIPDRVKSRLALCLQNSLQHIPVHRLQGSVEDVYQAIAPQAPAPLKGLYPITERKVLFGICGIGNGHLNRQLPCLHEMMSHDYRIVVFTHGQALTHFRSKQDRYANVTVCEIVNPYIVGCRKGLNFDATAQYEENNVKDFNRINFNAMSTAERLIGKPDLVVSDYEQMAAQYAYSKRAPLVTLDQQSKFLVGDFPAEIDGTSCRDERERLSMFFPVAARRIAVSFFSVEKKTAANKQDDFDITLLPPVVRPEIVRAAKEGDKTDRNNPSILFYVTSQFWERLPITEWIETVHNDLNKRFRVNMVLPRDFPLPKESGQIRFYSHGDPRFDEMLITCSGIISTAGHSLLSEAMLLGKPVCALPLKLYEQQLNAKIIDDHQFGLSVDQLSPEVLETFCENLDDYAENIRSDDGVLLHGDGQKAIMDIFDSVIEEQQS